MSLKGKLLVATPPLADPNFDRTVVLLLEHGTQGAVGLVLNRPSDTPVREQLPTWADRVGEPDLLFVGGPVQEDAIIALALASEAVPTEAFSPVRGPMGTVDLTAEPDEVGVVLQAVRVFAGYAGWGPGQLEGELQQRAWIVVAGWMRYVGGRDESGQPIDVRDPMAARLRALAEGADPVVGLLGVREVFPEAISARLAGPVGAAYGRIAALGARGAVAELGGGT
jgi:putative transcriptional regulator